MPSVIDNKNAFDKKEDNSASGEVEHQIQAPRRRKEVRRSINQKIIGVGVANGHVMIFLQIFLFHII